MKNIILILIATSTFSVHAAGFFEELTGEAARQRTAEARAQAEAARNQAQQAINQAQARRNEIAAKRAQMESDRKKMEAWYKETHSFVAAEATKIPGRTEQIARLRANLLDQIAKVHTIRDVFKAYAEQALRCSKAAEGALQISQLASRQQIGTGNLLVSFAMARQESDILQLGGLNSLAWNRGYEALYSTLPATQHLEAQLRAYVGAVNVESATETMNLIQSVLAGLEVQAERAGRLFEGSNQLQVAYTEIQKEMAKK